LFRFDLQGKEEGLQEGWLGERNLSKEERLKQKEAVDWE